MIDVIVNPIAGNGYARKQAERVLGYLQGHGAPHRVHRTAERAHATQLARRAAQQGAARVLCVGGDGTVLETAQGLMGTEVPLGIVPSGTGNDFAQTLGLPKRFDALMPLLLEGPARRVDVGLMNDRPFLNIIGTGFDVEVLRWTLHFKRRFRGMLPYLLGVCMTIFTHRDVRLAVTVDGGERMRLTALLIAVANGKSYGGGMKVAKPALVDDGRLDLVIVQPLKRWRIPFLLPSFLNGGFLRRDFAAHRVVDSVVIEGEGLSFNLDGEILEETRVEVRLAKEKVWFVAGTDG